MSQPQREGEADDLAKIFCKIVERKLYPCNILPAQVLCRRLKIELAHLELNEAEEHMQRAIKSNIDVFNSKGRQELIFPFALTIVFSESASICPISFLWLLGKHYFHMSHVSLTSLLTFTKEDFENKMELLKGHSWQIFTNGEERLDLLWDLLEHSKLSVNVKMIHVFKFFNFNFIISETVRGYKDFHCLE